MTTSDANPMRDKLLTALAESDEMRRSARADRILWLSDYRVSVGMFEGPMDTVALLNEAHDCFVEGHFIGALLTAVAFIEHTISVELLGRGLLKYGDTFDKAIKVATTHDVFPPEMLEQTNKLREIRNPFAHRKPPTHEHTFGNRFRKQGIHPQAILEQDAKESVILMNQLFKRALWVGQFGGHLPG